jgi:hypothetical protein
MIGGRPHIDLNTTVAYLNVSPAFVGIATAVTTSLAPSKVRHHLKVEQHLLRLLLKHTIFYVMFFPRT